MLRACNVTGIIQYVNYKYEIWLCHVCAPPEIVRSSIMALVYERPRNLVRDSNEIDWTRISRRTRNGPARWAGPCPVGVGINRPVGRPRAPTCRPSQ